MFRRRQTLESYAAAISHDGMSVDMTVRYVRERGYRAVFRGSATFELPLEPLAHERMWAERCTRAHIRALREGLEAVAFLRERGIDVTYQGRPLADWEQEWSNPERPPYLWAGYVFEDGNFMSIDTGA